MTPEARQAALNPFAFQQIWNDSLEQRENRPQTPRKRIWASEMGGAMVDRYLKMQGIEPSNPPNPRSLRKFEAGNLMEWVVGKILKRAGLLVENQKWCNHQYTGLLEVSGKCDFIAGGKPDWDKAQKEVQDLEKFGLPDIFTKIAKNLVASMKEREEYEQIVLEIKSCSSFMYELYERKKQASNNHILQTFHYLKAMDYEAGHVVYISKDDLRILEIPVYRDSGNEALYRSDIERMSEAVMNQQQPPLERCVDFDTQFGRFHANWKVGYSNYLKMLYGLESQHEFDEKYKPVAERWNRVMTRLKKNKNGEKTPTGKPIEITLKNQAVLTEMRLEGWYPENMIDYFEVTKEDETE